MLVECFVRNRRWLYECTMPVIYLVSIFLIWKRGLKYRIYTTCFPVPSSHNLPPRLCLPPIQKPDGHRAAVQRRLIPGCQSQHKSQSRSVSLDTGGAWIVFFCWESWKLLVFQLTRLRLLLNTYSKEYLMVKIPFNGYLSFTDLPFAL